MIKKNLLYIDGVLILIDDDLGKIDDKRKSITIIFCS